MMWVSSENATKRRCPFGVGDERVVADDDGRGTFVSFCVGHMCMAWRSREGAPLIGYCGRVGGPK